MDAATLALFTAHLIGWQLHPGAKKTVKDITEQDIRDTIQLATTIINEVALQWALHSRD